MKMRREMAHGQHACAVFNPDAGGTPILALHGFTGSGLDWEPIASRLGRRMLAPDVMGHGDSPSPAEWESYRIGTVVDQCLQWCGDAPDWFLVGYSMGGRVALRLAPKLGARLRGVILISASPGLEGPVERTERMARDQALAGSIEEEGLAWFQTHWSSQPIIQSQQDIPAEILAPMQARREANRPAGLAGSLRGMGQGAVDPVWDRLKDLEVPTLLITGLRDERYTEIAARSAQVIPNARHVQIEEAGHCTHLEALVPVVDAMQSFLAELTNEGPSGVVG